MELQKQTQIAIFRQSFIIDLEPEDQIYFQSSKYMRERGKVQEYLAERIRFDFIGEIDLLTEQVGEVKFDTRWDTFSAVGTKVNANNEVVGTSSSHHDGFAVEDRKALAMRLLDDLDIDPAASFTAEVLGE